MQQYITETNLKAGTQGLILVVLLSNYVTVCESMISPLDLKFLICKMTRFIPRAKVLSSSDWLYHARRHQ